MSPILGGWPTHGRLPGFLEDKASHVPFLSHESPVAPALSPPGLEFFLISKKLSRRINVCQYSMISDRMMLNIIFFFFLSVNKMN